jgi:hypothetical protein
LSAKAPTAVLSLPVELNTIAAVPLAVFRVPAVFRMSAAVPLAVFQSPLLSASVPAPRPVLKLAVVLEKSEYQPKPELPAPVVRNLRAFWPSAVVKFGYPPSGGGLTACAISQSAKQANARGVKRSVVIWILIDVFIGGFLSAPLLPEGILRCQQKK